MALAAAKSSTCPANCSSTRTAVLDGVAEIVNSPVAFWEGCRAVVERLRREGLLRRDLNAAEAADLLWTITLLRTWEDLVLERGWSASQYEERIYRMLVSTLTNR